MVSIDAVDFEGVSVGLVINPDRHRLVYEVCDQMVMRTFLFDTVEMRRRLVDVGDQHIVVMAASYGQRVLVPGEDVKLFPVGECFFAEDVTQQMISQAAEVGLVVCLHLSSFRRLSFCKIALFARQENEPGLSQPFSLQPPDSRSGETLPPPDFNPRIGPEGAGPRMSVAVRNLLDEPLRVEEAMMRTPGRLLPPRLPTHLEPNPSNATIPSPPWFSEPVQE